MLESSEKYHEAKHVLADHGVKTGNVSLDLATMLGRKTKVIETLAKGIDGLMKKNKDHAILWPRQARRRVER